MNLAVAIGMTFPRHTVEVERGRLRFYAEVIGEEAPRFTDVDAAAEAGYPDLPVPPAFLFCLEMARPGDRFGYLQHLGIDLRKVLHGEQRFDYHAMAFAGDTLIFDTRITDAYEKKGGALGFLVRSTHVTRAGAPIADLTSTIVVTR
ncbi:MaoC family dehydratase N-terminal domain-containing protein [Rhizohabitans arisaemae]|uniref:MaoC family dehydratase N-terminal domain-containing protein n=1 Tax=Rhizohabitans arisaemae TaxID=2720610 RepID=UPI0024B06800|nr:MaoC family dehydratase N-terminal domain-containing protein [Rhizohabitans arisaemae]